jgi:hypothetical protein
MYKSITLWSLYTWNHKITVIGGAPPRLILGYLPTGAMPLYHSALGHARVHQNAETVRHSTGPQRSLCYLRRVWALPTLCPSNLAVVAPS